MRKNPFNLKLDKTMSKLFVLLPLVSNTYTTEICLKSLIKIEMPCVTKTSFPTYIFFPTCIFPHISHLF